MSNYEISIVGFALLTILGCFAIIGIQVELEELLNL